MNKRIRMFNSFKGLIAILVILIILDFVIMVAPSLYSPNENSSSRQNFDAPVQSDKTSDFLGKWGGSIWKSSEGNELFISPDKTVQITIDNKATNLALTVTDLKTDKEETQGTWKLGDSDPTSFQILTNNDNSISLQGESLGSSFVLSGGGL